MGSVVVCGVVCGSLWWSVVVCGSLWWSVVFSASPAEVFNYSQVTDVWKNGCMQAIPYLRPKCPGPSLAGT